jgi:ATP-dependent DNA ligase
VAKAATAFHRHDAARRAAVAYQPLRMLLVLSRVHWVRPELVAEVKFLTWTDDNLLRQVMYGVCARTSRRPGCAVRCRIRADNWNPDAHRSIIGRMGLIITSPHEFGNVQYAV